MQKWHRKWCNSNNCSPVFQQVIISNDSFEIELFSKDKNILQSKYQTVSGLLDVNTKFDSKDGRKKQIITEKVCTDEKRTRKIFETCT